MKHERAKVLAIAAFFLCLAGTLPGCRSKESRIAQHLEQAETYTDEGKLREAVLELRSALQLDPASVEVNWRLADLMRRQGRTADELFFYAETARLDPTRSDAILLQAGLLFGDDPDRARELIEGVIEREPENAQAHLRASELALLEEDLDAALREALTAAELEPGKGVYRQQVGVVYRAQIRSLRFQKGKEPGPEIFEKAIAAFEKANEIDGPYWEYETNIARVQRGRADHLADAEAAYRRALELAIGSNDPAAAPTVAAEIQAWAATTRNQGLARWAAERMTEARPQHVATWIHLANLEDAAGGDAEAVYRKMLEHNPAALAAHVAYARWLVSKGRAPDAFSHLEQARDAGIDEAELLGATANLQLMAGRLEEARATVDTLERDFPERPRTRLSAIQLAVAEGRLPEAVKLFETSEALRENPEALRMVAFAQLRLGNLLAAADMIGRAVALTPDFDASLVRLQATIQHQQRDWSAALQSFQRLARAGAPLDALEQLRWIQARYESGDAEGARQQLEALLASGQATPEAALEFAYRENERQPDRARTVLEEALERTPGDPRLISYLAQLDIRAGHPDRALERLTAAAATDPPSPLILLTRAELLASKKDWAGAEAELNRLLAVAPSVPRATELLVDVYRAQGKTEEAIRKLEESRGTATAIPGVESLLGRLYFAVGDTEKARARFESAIAVDPGNAQAKNDLAFLLARTGQDLDRALTLAQEAQQMLPQSAAVMDTLGYVYLRRGLHDPAREQLSLAIQMAEASGQARPEYYVHLAEAYRASGRVDDASTQIRKALELDPNHPEARAVEKELGVSTQSALPRAPGPP